MSDVTNSSTTALPTTPQGPDRQNRKTTRKNISAVIGGNAIEMYDWAIYASFAPFFAGQLFDKANPQSAMLATLAVFAVGFLARPLGGFVFGWIGDRIGRKAALTSSVALASAGSLVIGFTPTFENVGLLASIILLTARLLQGLAHGGEMPASQTYLSEMAPIHKRGLWSSLIYVSGTIGVVAGTLMGAVMTMLFTHDQMMAWGWRVPFIIGGVLGLYALIMRASLKETDDFKKVAAKPGMKTESIWIQIIAHRKQAAQVIGLTLGITVGYYTWAVATPTMAMTYHGIEAGTALWAGVIGNLAFMVSLPFWGKLSDKIGRKPLLMIGLGGSALMQIPMSWLFQGELWQLVVSMSIMLVLMGAMLSIMPATYAELFPTGIRTVGVAVPYSVCVALFGGTAPYLNAWLTGSFGGWAFPIYATLLFAVSFACIFGIRESRGKVLSAAEHS